MTVLREAFAAKAAEFRDVLKMGRTQLQDAVPMTLGQEFSAYAVMLDEDRSRLAEAVVLIHEINLGATAIGTGLNAPKGYAEAARGQLATLTGLPLVTAANLVEATQDCGAFVHLSGVLKRIAVKLSKSCNDLRLLSSGPRAGLAEINLPPVQAGSSIMPGKVNPVIPEVVNQVAFEVIGNDVTITMAAEAGQLQLNAFEPVILHSLSESITHLAAACRTLAERCVAGITANTETLLASVQNSIGLVTALNPRIGYTAATDIAKEALATGRGVAELVLEKGLLPADRLAALLRPEEIAGSGVRARLNHERAPGPTGRQNSDHDVAAGLPAGPRTHRHRDRADAGPRAACRLHPGARRLRPAPLRHGGRGTRRHGVRRWGLAAAVLHAVALPRSSRLALVLAREGGELWEHVGPRTLR